MTFMSRAHSPTFPSLHLRHSSFSNPFVALPTSQLILQPFRCFNYVTAHSPTIPSLYLCTAHSPNLPLLHLRHSSFSNPSSTFPTSQALHLRHLASRPCCNLMSLYNFILLFIASKVIHLINNRPIKVRIVFVFPTNTCLYRPISEILS